MDLKRCANGHYYDADKYKQCPHCGSASQVNETVAFVQSDSQDQVTVSLDQVPDVPKPAPRPAPRDEGKTVGFFADQMEREPVVGWLVCTQGKQRGQDFRLKTGRNFIGRSQAMDIRLADEPSVSRDKHAIVIFEPKANIFLAQPGESSALFYCNDKVILNVVEIRKNDRLQIGDVELMLIPCCDQQFNWRTDGSQAKEVPEK